MNKKEIILSVIIVFIAAALRLWGINKTEGLWNDEYMTWYVASSGITDDFFQKMFDNCHMPLYYFFLKFWMFIFNDSDVMLRLSSWLLGIFSVVSMYFLGKTYKNETCGFLCATFATLSSFLIYFSQEVRLYQFIFLIATWIVFFFIKSLRNPLKKYLIAYFVLNFILLITHTLGLVFMCINILIFYILLMNSKFSNTDKNIVQKYMIAFLGISTILFLPLIPFLFDVLTRETLSQNWSNFTFSKILFVYFDYFTPILSNITNSPINIFQYFSLLHNFWFSIFFVLIPFGISLFFISRVKFTKNVILTGLFVVALLYLFISIIASITGKMVLSTKYTIEIYPILILVFSVGVLEFKNVILRVLLLIIYFGAAAFYIFTNPNAPQKMERSEGNRIAAVLISKSHLKKDDYVISLYYPFYRYQKYIKFEPENLFNIDKTHITKYVLGEKYSVYDLKNNGKKLLKDEFIEQRYAYIDNEYREILKKIPKGKKILIIIPNQVAFLSSNDLKKIASNDKKYKEIPFIFMLFSYAKVKLIDTTSGYAILKDVKQDGVWTTLVFEKY